MLASDLKFLSEVSDLARTDFEAASLTLAVVGKTFVARYQGAYSGGQRWRDIEDDLDGLTCTVSAIQFRQLVGLFDDEENVTLKLSANDLVLSSNKRKRVNLRTRGAALGIEPFSPITTGGQVMAIAEVSDVLPEVTTAAEFAARSMSLPVLTGLLVRAANGKLGIQASDGQSALFETRADVETVGNLSLVAPAFDLVLGLKLVKDKTFAVIKIPDKQGFDIYGEFAQMHCSEVAGSWPTSGIARVRQTVARQPAVSLDGSTVKALTTAVRVLGTRNDLRFRADGTTLFLETIDAESGDFIAEVPAPGVTGTYVFDVNNILLAQHVGSPIEMQLPVDPRHPTLVTAGARSYWIGAKSY